MKKEAPVPSDVQIVIFWALPPCRLADGCLGFVLLPFGKDESVKGEVPVLNLTKHYAITAYGEVDV
jgi:hypothetical protein